VNEDSSNPVTPFEPIPTSFEDTAEGAVWTWHPPPRRKFQHNYRRHILLFVATLVTTTFSQAFWMGPGPAALFTWPTIAHGLWYSLPLLAILGSHEFGHYFACRYHNVDATLPYFLPVPVPLTGTLGAVIRIREVFPSKRALFDIGVAGPLAGFVVLLPFLVWGIHKSSVAVIPPDAGVLFFGEPLLWKAVAWLHFGTLPQGVDVTLHPMGFAAWWGMLATALNLLPFGQLDGGHIMYAVVGRRAAWLSGLTLLVVVLLTMRSPSWFSMALLMVAMAFFFGFRHPRIIGEHEPLDSRRRVVALVALIVFILCFTPTPIDTLAGH
jgi:membrane-associated protease RseP (regulator of RpoE activity)